MTHPWTWSSPPAVSKEHLAWEPLCLSSPSASTEYLSTYTSPYEEPALLDPHRPNPERRALYEFLGAGNPLFAAVEDLINNKETHWHEALAWSAPIPIHGCAVEETGDGILDSTIQDIDTSSSPETPAELNYTLSQDEIDASMVEMTCGSKLEEHFWPIRWQIRHGQLCAYENAIHTLIVEARKQRQPAILSKLTGQSIPCSPSSLASFLYDSLIKHEHLTQIATEIQASYRFTEAMWEDNLMIVLVFYEMLTSKTDLDDLLKFQGVKAQFILDLAQNVIQTHFDFVHIVHGGTPRIRGPRRLFLDNIVKLGLLRNVDRVSAQLDARRFLVALSEICDLLPSSLEIYGVECINKDPALGGTFGDIFLGRYRGEQVALKRLRIFQGDLAENLLIRRKFCREALIWKCLDHEYILPFFGVDSKSFPGFLCMVSPWMSNGPIVTTRGGPDPDRIPILIHEIAVGLQYLHSQNIVHGDLRGANILLDDEGHARLADFGLAVFVDGPLSPTKRGGSTRWMAPELLNPESCKLDAFQRTFASDIYSLACVYLELYTGKPPFADIFSDAAVMLKVIKGDRPTCPPEMPVWCSHIISKCWCQLPVNRPGTGNIIESIVRHIKLDRQNLRRSYTVAFSSDPTQFTEEKRRRVADGF